ncbi:DUF2935 domain-containing protein [Clostridium magnum]|uniref:Uncharacterized protein n=1 Tax=Clostridium magnum DSM 2767 TaxID=1121326 RepID=A0A161X3F6_9CLOT|nr:DUF2935 domain-containing protein [Clostridium magnum]KZL94018.1 hypothetical protein CLMAG_10710 [Clostridium magnum DSM 2767]SHI00481.1 protein of unknown function [Clostridium magnum DSM 2767]
MYKRKEDLLFWIGIMRDHSIFQSSTFAPKEVTYIKKSMMFRDFFQAVMDKVKSEYDLEMNIPSIMKALNDFINFKRQIVKGLLTCKLEINLLPSFISHQINEAMEFRFELMSPQNYLECLKRPICFIDFLKKWIADGSGHASTYASFLDPTESILRDEALAFKMKFDMLSVKANELQMMMMQSESGESALIMLAAQVEDLMKKFILYLEKMLKHRSECKVMAIGTLSPLLPNHMIREHKYSLNKINEYIENKNRY